MRERHLKVRFCGDCGRMILVGFEFCPYCGSPIRPGQESQSSSPDPERPWNPPSIPRDARDARLLLDRLIRELEALDAEMEEWAAVRERWPADGKP